MSNYAILLWNRSRKIGERKAMQRLTLNIGKLHNGELWLCLADADTTAVYPIAQFQNKDCADAFEAFMGTQGYAAVKLPNDSEIEQLLGDEPTTES
jgi:hypothetical protein